MRTRVLSGLVGLGLAVGLAGGQPPDPKPKPADGRKPLGLDVKPADKKGSLEEAIGQALRNNPDVRVAEAEVQLAQAKLNQAKLTVAQRVSTAHLALDRARADAKVAEANFARFEHLRDNKSVSSEMVDEARAKLDAAKAAVAKAEAEHNAALGVMPGKATAVSQLNVAFSPDGRLVALEGGGSLTLVGESPKVTAGEFLLSLAAKPAPGSVADKLREALDKPVTIKSDGGMSLRQFLDWLNKEAGLDVTFRAVLTTGLDQGVSIQPGTLSLGAILQLIEDENAKIGLRFYIREYGVLATDGNTPPPGAVAVAEFWKQVKAEKAKEKDKADPKK